MTAKQITEIISSIISTVVKILVVIWLVNFIYSKAVAAYDFGFRVFTEEAVSPAPGRDITFAITEGKTDKAIAESLAEKGLVRDAKLAYIQILASEYKDKIEPGVYTLNTSQTLEEMMQTIAYTNYPPEEEE